MWDFVTILFSLVGHRWNLCREVKPIEGLFFWQLRSGNMSGQWASETRLPVPHCGSRAGVRCRWAVSFPVRCLLPSVQIWGKKAATHYHALGMSCSRSYICWLRYQTFLAFLCERMGQFFFNHDHLKKKSSTIKFIKSKNYNLQKWIVKYLCHYCQQMVWQK